MNYQFYHAEYPIQLDEAKASIESLFYIFDKLDAGFHVHSYMELHYITEGSVVFRMDLSEMVTLNAGEWLIVPRGVYHEETVRPSTNGFVLGFDVNEGENKGLFHSIAEYTYHPHEADPYVGELLHRIIDEANEQKQGYEICCKSLFFLLLVHMQRKCEKRSSLGSSVKSKRSSRKAIVDLFFNRIFNQDGEDLTPARLAAELNVSERHMNRILLEEYGTLFRQKLIDTKIKYAEYLLKSTDYSIEKISEMCGFSSDCLTRNFQKNIKFRHLNTEKQTKRTWTEKHVRFVCCFLRTGML